MLGAGAQVMRYASQKFGLRLDLHWRCAWFPGILNGFGLAEDYRVSGKVVGSL